MARGFFWNRLFESNLDIESLFHLWNSFCHRPTLLNFYHQRNCIKKCVLLFFFVPFSFICEWLIHKLAGSNARSSCGSRWFYLRSEVFERMVQPWTWNFTHDKSEAWTLPSCTQPRSSFRHSGVAAKELKSVCFLSH